jgi:hypothetical protein
LGTVKITVNKVSPVDKPDVWFQATYGNWFNDVIIDITMENKGTATVKIGNYSGRGRSLNHNEGWHKGRASQCRS